MADKVLDAKGLNCPLPILKAKKALAGLRGGQTLRITATDPESVRDFATFCRQSGHELLETREEGGRWRAGDGSGWPWPQPLR